MTLSLEQLVHRISERQHCVRLGGLRGSSRAFVAAKLIQEHGPRPVLVVSPTSKTSEALFENLQTALGTRVSEARLRSFPRHDTLPFERFSPQPFVVTQRMSVLYLWLRSANAHHQEVSPIVVTPWTALCLRVPARELVRSYTVHLEVGQRSDRDVLIERLLAAGYARMPLVEERGEMAVRGGILDLFPPQAARPVRIEFFGDEIESIREFDPTSQRSHATLSSVACAPAREMLFPRDRVIEQGDRLRELAAAANVPASDVDGLIDALLRGSVPPGAEVLAPILLRAQESVLDFLPDDTLILVDDLDGGEKRLAHYQEEIQSGFATAQIAKRLVCAPQACYVEPAQLLATIRTRRAVFLEQLDLLDSQSPAENFALATEAHDELRRRLLQARSEDAALQPLIDALAAWQRDRFRITLTAHSLSSAERLRTLLHEYGLDAHDAKTDKPMSHWSAPGRIDVRVATLSAGFVLPNEHFMVLTEDEIFGPREKTRHTKNWRKTAELEGIAQLSLGDPIVHIEHGIGLYRGLVSLQFGQSLGDFLKIEFDAGDKLFLPIHRMNLVQRYVGADGHSPQLDRLGGSTWQKKQQKIKDSLRDMATELLNVHAARELAPGFAFSPRDRHLEEFEAAFPYEETSEQLAAIEDVLVDMASEKPMDRLVCGDVGYGKTEVAIRAAFRAAMDGKQVAVLVPTTVLAQQHEETFRKRFEGHALRIECLSRFRSTKECKEILDGLATGSIDIVIGTHRLLQKNVQFRNLGLLVVDEEQRFGVAHKERIKKLKKTVDVLTLTATPIPRTLQQAFTGIRSLSLITTPPTDRLAIRTQVAKFSESLIREAILREMQRGGQVFFVHNRVQTIGAIHEMLTRVVPEAKVLVAHGQMKESDLEDRMFDFMHGKADVLLCTAIIENGLDVPRANTILINRSNTFGLSQLYQLRGRVGRSNHRAYAYLLVPSEEGLTKDAERRLEAIQDLSELGSGFRLATLDLEIRGAGNLLGEEQSGNIAAVGYDTYMSMLEETMEELRGKVHDVEVDPEIRLPVSARLAEDYVPDVGQRLVLYKRLASAPNEDEVARIREEILDRYGPLPAEAEYLCEVIRIKILARTLGIAAVDLADEEVVLTAAATSKIDPARLISLLTQPASGIRVTPNHKIFARIDSSQPYLLFPSIRGVLKRLAHPGSGH